MLEFEDIQHLLLTRTPALTGRYEFLSFGSPAGGRAWLTGIRETVRSAAEVRASSTRQTLGDSCLHLNAYGRWAPEASLATSRRVQARHGGSRGDAG
jgi:hypothetical protein